MKAKIVVLPGDGVGPEVVAEARKVLEAVASKQGHELSFENQRIRGVNMLLVRELTGGLYFGKQYREKTENGIKVVDTLEYTDKEIERVCRLAFGLARGRSKKLT